MDSGLHVWAQMPKAEVMGWKESQKSSCGREQGFHVPGWEPEFPKSRLQNCSKIKM